ncbi:hypothetical protein FHETE_838 [Fusarium heterosporum]|uniref:Uncharacterized protein n=1 Tax=Fusarium heterosporum TaxID=42747 RepID=A0A8H5TYE2_FUSHE|nr:hypothetical protein FHETE_838 [Fusarium heterosporum]
MKFLSLATAAALGATLASANPVELSKRVTYTFKVNSGQVQKCAPSGSTVNCTFQTCWVPRLIDGDGNVIAGAASEDDKDWKCASIDDVPDYSFYNIKFTEVSCDKPYSIGGGVTFCTGGDGGRVAHFPTFVLDGKPGWCNMDGPDDVGIASCTLGFA